MKGILFVSVPSVQGMDTFQSILAKAKNKAFGLCSALAATFFFRH
jgi:hypothetical protein